MRVSTGFFASLLLVVSCATPRTPSDTSARKPEGHAMTGKAQLGAFGLDLSTRNLTTKPGDDFAEYATGAWMKSRVLEPDELMYGTFVELSYRTEERLKVILDELGKRKHPAGTTEQKLGDAFAAFMDEKSLDAKGVQPIAPDLVRIRSIKNIEELVVAFAHAELDDTAAPFSVSVDLDRRNSNRYMLEVTQSGLGLPDRALYLEESSKALREAYTTHVATMLAFGGLSGAEAQTAATQVMALETSMAKIHRPRTELRDADKTSNIYSLSEFEAKYPGYPWRRHLTAAGYDLDKIDKLNVATPAALEPLAKLVSETPLEAWKHYLSYHLITHLAPLLGSRIDEANFAFRGKTLLGQTKQRARWKRAVERFGAPESLGHALGRLYVERYFPPEAKARMVALVDNLRVALRARIERLDWMGPETKREALHKLSTFNPKIGYPDQWRDFSGLSIVPGDVVANHRAIRTYWVRDSLKRLGTPTDKAEWFMAPHTINAYYNARFNEIVFPAAILQPPFFDPNADAAVNYGAIGAVIGHEIGHGFDDQGSKFDADGTQRNWWTNEDRKRFDARAQALVAQYNHYEPIQGHHVDGELTLGENIGDLGGVSMAFEAYRLSLGNQKPPVLDGLTGPQRFFLSWAQVWKSKARDEVTLQLLKTDNHSPGVFRINGVVRNVDGWYEAFDVTQRAGLYLPPEKRVRIW